MAVGGECLAGLLWFAHPPTRGAARRDRVPDMRKLTAVANLLN